VPLLPDTKHIRTVPLVVLGLGVVWPHQLSAGDGGKLTHHTRGWCLTASLPLQTVSVRGRERLQPPRRPGPGRWLAMPLPQH
jgi:hypothetical protein